MTKLGVGNESRWYRIRAARCNAADCASLNRLESLRIRSRFGKRSGMVGGEEEKGTASKLKGVWGTLESLLRRISSFSRREMLKALHLTDDPIFRPLTHWIYMTSGRGLSGTLQTAHVASITITNSGYSPNRRAQSGVSYRI